MKDFIQSIFHRAGFDIRPYKTSAHFFVKKLLHLQKIDLVLDVGANQGQYRQFLKTVGYKGKIVSFEPVSYAYEKLQQKSASDNLWTIAPRMALGNTEGEITINIAGNEAKSSSILNMLDIHKQNCPESSYVSSEVVPINRLDVVASEYIKNPEHQQILLKIDTQGYEKYVLEGAVGILDLVRAIQLEMSLVQVYDGSPTFKEMLYYLESIGYTMHWLKPGFSDKSSGRMLQLDAFFLKV